MSGTQKKLTAIEKSQDVEYAKPKTTYFSLTALSHLSYVLGGFLFLMSWDTISRHGGNVTLSFNYIVMGFVMFVIFQFFRHVLLSARISAWKACTPDERIQMFDLKDDT